jgi:hypothetical protein
MATEHDEKCLQCFHRGRPFTVARPELVLIEKRPDGHFSTERCAIAGPAMRVFLHIGEKPKGCLAVKACEA